MSRSTLPCVKLKSHRLFCENPSGEKSSQTIICIERTCLHSISYVKVTHSWHSADIYLKTLTLKISEDSIVETVFRRNAKRALLWQIN